MFTKLKRLQAIADTGVILIVRLDDAEEAYQVATAAIAGGIRALEITYSVPNALRIIERLASEHPEVVVGAGTVLDAQAAYAAIQAGAQLLVSPNLSPEMLAVANRYQAVSISGAFTPTEIVNSAEAGADLVKLFPAEVLGPQYVKSVMAPLAHIPVAPTGGVTPENVGEWFAAGVAAVGVGSFVTKAEHAPGDYEPVAIAAKTFLAAVDSAIRKPTPPAQLGARTT